MAETMEEQRPSFNLRKFYEAKDNSVASMKTGMPYLCECQGNGAYRILVLLYGDFTPLYSEVFYCSSETINIYYFSSSMLLLDN